MATALARGPNELERATEGGGPVQLAWKYAILFLVLASVLTKAIVAFALAFALASGFASFAGVAVLSGRVLTGFSW